MACALFGLAPPARADTIVQSTATNSSLSDLALGQSVLTPNGGPWGNITFNFYNSSNNPFAVGSLYLLNQAYGGTPANLSSSTTGYIATGTASGGTSWVFDPSVTLQSNMTYFFYMGSTSGATGLKYSTVNPYAGGNDYATSSATSNFVDQPTVDAAFTLSGTPNPGPLPGSGLLSWAALCFGGIAMRFRLCLAAARTACRRVNAAFAAHGSVRSAAT
jgi:hypothetical protein